MNAALFGFPVPQGGPPGGGGGPPGPSGPARDPYLTGGWGSSVPADRKRVAKDTYWAIRLRATSCRNYVMQCCSFDKKSQLQTELWQAAEIVDLEVDRVYQEGQRRLPPQGKQAIDAFLDTSDAMEHLLSRIGAEVSFKLTGDAKMYRELLSCKNPMASEILPEWALAGARDASKQMYQQAQRVGGTGGCHD